MKSDTYYFKQLQASGIRLLLYTAATACFLIWTLAAYLEHRIDLMIASAVVTVICSIAACRKVRDCRTYNALYRRCMR